MAEINVVPIDPSALPAKAPRAERSGDRKPRESKYAGQVEEFATSGAVVAEVTGDKKATTLRNGIAGFLRKHEDFADVKVASYKTAEGAEVVILINTSTDEGKELARTYVRERKSKGEVPAEVASEEVAPGEFPADTEDMFSRAASG